MAHAKNHDYHLVNPSPWPFVGAMSAFALAIGLITWMHGASVGPFVFGAGLLGVLYTMMMWWLDVIKEAAELYLETLPLDERDALLSREILTTAVEVNA